MKVTLEIENVQQIDISLEAIERVIDGEPIRICDLAPLIGMKTILMGIKKQYQEQKS